jgi:hypothetical protein
MKQIARDKRRVALGVGLIVTGVGLIGRFFLASHPFDPATAPAFWRFVTYGGALIAITGAAALLGRRNERRWPTQTSSTPTDVGTYI